MATFKEELQIFLTMKDKATKQFQKIDAQLTKTSKKLDGMKKATDKASIAIVAIGAVAVVAAKKAIKAFQEQEMAEARLEQIAKQVTGATEEQIDAYKELASEMQKVGVLGDEVIIAGQSQIASFTKSAEVVEELSDDLADLAVAQYGTNVTQEQAIQTANLLGKALSGQLGALTRTGILVNGEFKQAFENANTEQERAVIISKIVQDNYGGLNETMRKTSAGGVQALKNSFGDLMETIGERLLPVLQWLVDGLTGLIDKFSNLNEFIDEHIVAINIAIGVLAILATSFLTLKAVLLAQGVLKALGLFSKALGLATTQTGLLTAALAAVPTIITITVALVGFALVMSQIRALKKSVGEAAEAASDLEDKNQEAIMKARELQEQGEDEAAQRLLDVVKRNLNIGQTTAEDVFAGKSITEMPSQPSGINIPGFADGGVVTKPTLAMVGEGGESEAIIPLSKFDKMGGGDININIYGDVTGDDAMEKLSQKIMDNLGLNSRITVGV